MSLENRGVPAVVICTKPFVNSALIHARTFGAPEFEPVAVPHPLGGIAHETVRERALAIQEQVIAVLTGSG